MNITEQSVTLDNGQRVAESEVDQGLFESLMGMGMGTLRRNKKSRNSTKNRYENQTFEDICSFRAPSS